MRCRVVMRGRHLHAGHLRTQRADAEREQGRRKERRAPHCGMPRKSGCERKLCSHPLGEVPCSTVGPACVVAAESGSAVMTRRNLFMSTWPTVVVPFFTVPSRTHFVRSVEVAHAT